MMTADINREQLILLAQCVLFGAGAGLCYDVFRAARRVLCPGRAGETACDALFCVLMLAAAFRFAIVNAAFVSLAVRQPPYRAVLPVLPQSFVPLCS